MNLANILTRKSPMKRAFVTLESGMDDVLTEEFMLPEEPGDAAGEIGEAAAPGQDAATDRERLPRAGGAETAEEAARALDTAYAWLEQRLTGRSWAAGTDLSMADCAAAPSLFYADWVHRIGDRFPRLRDYRAQLLAHPSFARAVEEGRPYRPNFPLGAPDRD